MKTFQVIALLLAWLPSSHAREVKFNRDVRPILSNHCFACHGQDAKKRKGKLRLDKGDVAIAERDGGQASAPGNLEKSEAWTRILSEDEDEVNHGETSGAHRKNRKCFGITGPGTAIQHL